VNGYYQDFGVLVGMVLTTINVTRDGDDVIDFVCDDGVTFRMFHEQACCECVNIEDICGDIDDLLGSPILVAEELSNSDGVRPESADDSWTWTFYHIRTMKGTVTIRWFGTSNGSYSESVAFVKIRDAALRGGEG